MPFLYQSELDLLLLRLCRESNFVNMLSSDDKTGKLPIAEHASDGDSDDQPIWDRATSKRRRKGYLPLSKVAKIFPDMEPKLLCQVSEMVTFTPLEVLALIPKATSP